MIVQIRRKNKMSIFYVNTQNINIRVEYLNIRRK